LFTDCSPQLARPINEPRHFLDTRYSSNEALPQTFEHVFFVGLPHRTCLLLTAVRVEIVHGLFTSVFGWTRVAWRAAQGKSDPKRFARLPALQWTFGRLRHRCPAETMLIAHSRCPNLARISGRGDILPIRGLPPGYAPPGALALSAAMSSGTCCLWRSVSSGRACTACARRSRRRVTASERHGVRSAAEMPSAVTRLSRLAVARPVVAHVDFAGQLQHDVSSARRRSAGEHDTVDVDRTPSWNEAEVDATGREIRRVEVRRTYVTGPGVGVRIGTDEGSFRL
jgi:hypothetical protein